MDLRTKKGQDYKMYSIDGFIDDLEPEEQA